MSICEWILFDLIKFDPSTPFEVCFYEHMNMFRKPLTRNFVPLIPTLTLIDTSFLIV